jgi:hypothetical protein
MSDTGRRVHCMNRRDFTTPVGGAAAWPVAAHASAAKPCPKMD